MANKPLFKPKEIAPGMFRSPTPVSKEAQKLAEPPAPVTPTKEEEELPPVPVGTQPEPSAEVKPKSAAEEEWDGLIRHAKEVRDNIISKWAGKPGVNPFIWVKENIDPLVEKAKQGQRNDDLKKQLFKLSSDVKPVVNERVKDVVGKPPTNVN